MLNFCPLQVFNKRLKCNTTCKRLEDGTDEKKECEKKFCEGFVAPKTKKQKEEEKLKFVEEYEYNYDDEEEEEAEVKEIEAGAKARVDEALRPKEEGVKVEGEVSNDPIGDRYQIPKDIRELAEYKQVDDFFGQQKKHIKGLMEGVTCLLGN